MDISRSHKKWVFWDPAAGSGRLYAHFPEASRVASDLYGDDFSYPRDSFFFPKVDFLTNIICPLQNLPHIYIVANPSYGDLTHQFINRAFDGTYHVKRAIFIVSARKHKERYLAQVDLQRCTLVKESPVFEAQFDLQRDPRKGGPPDYALNKNKVKILLYYSANECEYVRRVSPEMLYQPLLVQSTLKESIRLMPTTAAVQLTV
jgi:hypothetical protein